MKKSLYLIYGFIIIAFIILLFYAENNERSKSVKQYSQIIFDDRLITANNIIEGQYIKNNNKLVLVFLSTHCEYCTEVIGSLIANAIDEKYQLLLVFNESNSSISSYIQNFQTEELQNKIIYSDSFGRLSQLFKIKTVPSFFVVDNTKVVENGFGADEINKIIKGLR